MAPKHNLSSGPEKPLFQQLAPTILSAGSEQPPFQQLAPRIHRPPQLAARNCRLSAGLEHVAEDPLDGGVADGPLEENLLNGGGGDVAEGGQEEEELACADTPPCAAHLAGQVLRGDEGKGINWLAFLAGYFCCCFYYCCTVKAGLLV